MLKVGILGLGTVGGGVIKILRERSQDFKNIVGEEIQLVKVMSRRDHRLAELGIDSSLYTNSFDEFLAEPMDIMVEAIGGEAPADVIKKALKKGCKVVTANKALLATQSEELMGSDTGDALFFEASCCGGIPIVSSFEEGLLSNKMEQLLGIFNGTCNYILTEMSKGDVSFDEVLKVAQDLGYAEADPTFDVEGIDATHKLCLLGSLAFREKIDFSNIPVQGITVLSPEDFAWAAENDHVIKLISMAERHGSEIFAGTFPCLLPSNHPMAHVNGANNAVFVRGEYAGDLMFYGAGAGELPTASAVVSDILAAAQGKARHWSHHVFRESTPVQLSGEKPFSYYLRLKAKDEAGVLAKLCDSFGKRDISLRFVHQNPAPEGHADIIFTTHPTSSLELMEALKEMAEQGWVTGQPFMMRMLEI
jgi:homoserine dehydrogenase